MPYVTDKWKHKYQRCLVHLASRFIEDTMGGKENTGVVVYAVYLLLKRIYGEGNFETRSNALKVLESAKLEYYRRVMVPYEDKKIIENGDVI
ncbi:MAG: hypothetical protein KKC55_16885 [Gammaproteobacteria bacterium]|nr:hypothetical protein [Gammaproteobacteria bacterium]